LVLRAGYIKSREKSKKPGRIASLKVKQPKMRKGNGTIQ